MTLAGRTNLVYCQSVPFFSLEIWARGLSEGSLTLEINKE